MQQIEQEQNTLAMFTVYESEYGIEVLPGCDDYNTWRVICTCLSYERAIETAQSSAEIHSLPLINHVLFD